jgi:hypothetical protein
MRLRQIRGRLFLPWLVASFPLLGQEAVKRGIEESTEVNRVAPCLQPPPLVDWDQYEGPFQKVVAPFARKLERKSAHQPHYRPGAILCSLEWKDKLFLFASDTMDPVSIGTAGFNAGLGQASNQDSAFGQGVAGYLRRFSTEYASDTSARFLGEFVFPTLFRQDPRYYRLGHGSATRRTLHAVRHTVYSYSDSGNHMFNVSEWAGGAASVAVNNALHPGNPGGVVPVVRTTAYTALTDTGFNILREFWPEVARTLRLPFRGYREPKGNNTLQQR